MDVFLAQRYFDWLAASYVSVSILMTWAYSSFLAVHANDIIHGDLTGVSLTFLEDFVLLRGQHSQMYSFTATALLASPILAFL
jgi:hypothetical protein